MPLVMYGAIAAGVALAVGVDGHLGIVALLAAVLAGMVVFFVAHAYVDVVGEVMQGNQKIVSEGVVIGGRWWHPK